MAASATVIKLAVLLSAVVNAVDPSADTSSLCSDDEQRSGVCQGSPETDIASALQVSRGEQLEAGEGIPGEIGHAAKKGTLSWYAGLGPKDKIKWANRVRKLHNHAMDIVQEIKGLDFAAMEAKLKSMYSWAKIAVKLYQMACTTVPSRSSGVDKCGKCVEKSLGDLTGFCRWCPAEQSCEAAGFAGRGLSQVCSASQVGINSKAQCWAQESYMQIGDLVAARPSDAEQWVLQSTLHFDNPLQPFRTYPNGSTGMFDLSTGQPLKCATEGLAATGLILGGAADWGSGTGEAAVVGGLLAAEKPHMTFHLGDVYWAGTPFHWDSAMLGIAPNKNQKGVTWPTGSVQSFLMNGNHEMISGGTGYMENGFGLTGQQASFAAFQSDHWRFISLDSAYKCYGGFPSELNNPRGARNIANETNAPQPDEVFNWLKDVVKIGDENDKRGIVIMTHHQPYSNWEEGYLGTAKQLSKLLPVDKHVVWFFGHEHRLALYEPMRLSDQESRFWNNGLVEEVEHAIFGSDNDGDWVSNFIVHPRMVGNGGFPNTVGPPYRNNSLKAYDNRSYQSIPQTPFDDKPVGYNGYFKMVVDGPKLDVTYVTGKCKSGGCNEGYDLNEKTIVATESFVVDLTTGNLTHEWGTFGPIYVYNTSRPVTVPVETHLTHGRPTNQTENESHIWQLQHHMD